MIESSVVFLPVSDIKKTEIFYHDVLGLKISERQNDNLLIFDTGYGYWGFCQYGDGRELLSGERGVCLSLDLPSEEEVREKYEEIRERCEVYKTPAHHPVFPVYSFFVFDPDHYVVEFQKR